MNEIFCQLCQKVIGPTETDIHPLHWCDCEEPLVKSMKNCDRCGKLLRENELRRYFFETCVDKEDGYFCVDCWVACSISLDHEYTKSIRKYFFPLTKWDEHKKDMATKSLKHKDKPPTNLA